MQEIALSNVEDFNYDVVSPDSSKVLKALSEQLDGVYKNYQVIVGEIFYKAQQELSSYGDGLFSKWVESQGFSRTNAYNYINSYKFVQNLNKPKKEIFDSVPKSLQFEMAKNSALEDANQAVFNGDVKTHKEYKELERRLKLKDQALEAVKGELERVKAVKPTEKVIEKEIIPDDYKATQNLNKQLLDKNKDLADELDSVKRSLRLKEASYEMLEKETSEALALKESIEHLRADKEKLENSVTNIFNLSKLVTKFETFFDEEMAPLRFKTLIQGIGKDAQIEKLRDILTLTENWLDEMNKIVPENGRTIIEGEIINE